MGPSSGRSARPALKAGASLGPTLDLGHVRLFVLLVAGAIFIGTAGYVVIERWSVSDALYMTISTLATVGFGEVRPLDEAGRAWTILLMIVGVGIIFGTIGIVAEVVVTEVSSTRREAKRMADQIAGLRDHYILCGYGRVGTTVARELLHGGQRVVVIDVEPTSLERARHDGHLVVEGDATEDATLRAAGIERARGLITTIDSDANNVYVTLSARALNPAIFLVGRANAAGSEAKVIQAGANRVVSPYTMAGRRIAELALRPRVADFIDAALSHGELAFSMEELEVRPGGPVEGRTVAELRRGGVFALAVVTGPGTYEANPPDDRRLVAGESLVVSGSSSVLKPLRERA
ncbi:MAG: potassium channel family protein [Chloroflexota bacterium]|nr:potassium channel family protein [Chloroflexota bacterium]